MTDGRQGSSSVIIKRTSDNELMGAAPSDDQPERDGWRDYLFYAIVVALFLFAIIAGS
jgi:hypothetical protein